MKTEEGAPCEKSATLKTALTQTKRKRRSSRGQGRAAGGHLSAVTDAHVALAAEMAPGCDVVVDSPAVACLCSDMLCRHIARVGQAQQTIHALICSCGGAR